MIQLALESTGKTGSLAILDGETVLWERRFGVQKRAAAEITVDLAAALTWCDNQSQPLQTISVAVGPGSFTGLRIAITTAKTLAYALNLPVIPIGSLAAIAAATKLRTGQSQILVGLNAYRNQIFAAQFSAAELVRCDQMSVISQRAALDSRAHWDHRLGELADSADWVFAGDQAMYSDRCADRWAERQATDAAGVGMIAARWIQDRMEQMASGQPIADCFVDPFTLSARYLKSSAAEVQAVSR